MKPRHPFRIFALGAGVTIGSIAPVLAQEEAAAPPESASTAELEAIYRARTDSARMAFNEADVSFMTGMIHHHAQALVMAGFAPTHGASPTIQTLAARIINAQKDEIATMERWLRDRGQPVPDVVIDGTELAVGCPDPLMHAGHASEADAAVEGAAATNAKPEAHGDHDAHAKHGAELSAETAHVPGAVHIAGHTDMPGMLTPAQMAELDQAQGAEFDRLFLTYMIQHHQGAVTMVDELFDTDGAAQHTATFKLASDVQVDQRTEIARMERMLSALSAEGGAR